MLNSDKIIFNKEHQLVSQYWMLYRENYIQVKLYRLSNLGIYMYMYVAIINEKIITNVIHFLTTMNLKESKEGYVWMLEGRKGKRKI